MITNNERIERIALLERMISEFEQEDRAVAAFDAPTYGRAIDGLRGAVEFHQRMLDKSKR